MAELDLSSRARISDLVRTFHAQSAREGGNHNSLWDTAWSTFTSTSRRYTHSHNPIQVFEWDMHDLWNLYYHASMNIDDQRPEHDRLITQVLYAREIGVLTRTGANDEVLEAVTSDGKIWKDLPFLVGDMTTYWIEQTANISTDQRRNFASFLAKLSSTGVTDDHLCGCGLIILRDTLESKRKLTKPSKTYVSGCSLEEDDENVPPDDDSLSLAELLPAANSWLFHARHKIIRLSDKSINKFPDHVTMLGDLAQVGGDVPSAGGFSPQRWLFWLKRLEEIGKSTTTGEEEERIAAMASRMTQNMLFPVEEIESAMARQLREQGRLPDE